jgi:hypothetical protein
MRIYFRFLHNLSVKNWCNLHTNANGTLNKTFGKYLLLTNTVSSGVLMAAGDLIQQEIEKRRARSKRFDFKRTGLLSRRKLVMDFGFVV